MIKRIFKITRICIEYHTLPCIIVKNKQKLNLLELRRPSAPMPLKSETCPGRPYERAYPLQCA